MIIIPELQKIILLVPRTGTGALHRALMSRYPKAMMVYRHMEADGVPAGYDRWQKIGVLRHPVERLWSLHKVLRVVEGIDHSGAYKARMRHQARMPFEQWLVTNEIAFTDPYDAGNGQGFYPSHTVLHRLPENRKSQYVYLRPDLGTRIVPYEKLDALAEELNVTLDRHNCTESSDVPDLGPYAMQHVRRFFDWDMNEYFNLNPALLGGPRE